jgi:hypothetical protein
MTLPHFESFCAFVSGRFLRESFPFIQDPL